MHLLLLAMHTLFVQRNGEYEKANHALHTETVTTEFEEQNIIEGLHFNRRIRNNYRND